MPLALIPFVLLVVPILEITTFILVGKAIGVLPTLGLVIVSAVIGALLLRRQGLSTLARIQAEIAAGRVPGRELVHGVMIVAAGILLLTPGLLTDALGYLLFIPAVRDVVWRLLSRRVTVTVRSRAETMARSGRWTGAPKGPAGQPGRPGVVDLDEAEFERRPDPSSPWTAGSPDRPTTLH